jgi:hypothetical protein
MKLFHTVSEVAFHEVRSWLAEVSKKNFAKNLEKKTLTPDLLPKS